MDRGKRTRPRGNAATGSFHVAQDPPNSPLPIPIERSKKQHKQNTTYEPVFMLGLFGVDIADEISN